MKIEDRHYIFQVFIQICDFVFVQTRFFHFPSLLIGYYLINSKKFSLKFCDRVIWTKTAIRLSTTWFEAKLALISTSKRISVLWTKAYICHSNISTITKLVFVIVIGILQVDKLKDTFKFYHKKYIEKSHLCIFRSC